MSAVSLHLEALADVKRIAKGSAPAVQKTASAGSCTGSAAQQALSYSIDSHYLQTHAATQQFRLTAG